MKLRSRLVMGCALSVAGVLSPLTFADSLQVTAKLTGVLDAPNNSFTTVDLNLNGTAFNNAIAGAELWQYQSGTQVGQTTGYPAGTSFQTYCIEILQDVYLTNPPSPYTFTLDNSLADAPKPGLDVPGSGLSGGMGTVKADLIGRLWANDYHANFGADDSAAFQLAVWEIVYENQTLANGSLALDLTTGNFKDTDGTVGTERNTIRNTAQSWLTALAGQTGSANLIALTNDTYQDQITLNPSTSTVPAPLPSTAMGGTMLLGGLAGAVVLRRRRSAVA